MIKSKEFKKYFFNTSWMIFEQILRMIVAFFISVYVARYLGPDRYGLLNYSMSFVALFSAIATLGLDQIIIRDIVKEEEKRDLLLGTAFWLKIIGALLLMGLLVISVQLTSNDGVTNMMIIIIGAGTLFQSMNVIDFYFRSKVQSKFVVYAKTWTLFISSVSKLLFVYFEAPLLWFVLLLFAENVILAFGLLFNYIRQGLSIFSWKFDSSLARELVKNSWPLILSGIVVSIYMKIDQVMIKEMLGSQAVGIYSVAVFLSENWYFIPVAISESIFPAIINTKKISETLYHERLQKFYSLMIWTATLIAIPTSFLADWAIELLYGHAYSEAGGILKIYIWAGLFVFVGVASGKWYIVENLQKYFFYITFIGCVINVFLNIILIEKFGIAGAAIATLISQLVASYLGMVIFKSTRKNFWLATNAFNPINFLKDVSLKNLYNLIKNEEGI